MQELQKDELSGFKDVYKIKLKSAGFRLVYEVKDKDVIVLALTVGKRENNAVYDELKNRFQ